jgi:predicted Zn-ribbon and HTH transcriptional regulator
MMITLVAHDPCALCGYVREGFMVSTVRINKRSMRSYGQNLRVLPGKCRECGWVAPWPLKVKLRPAADDLAKIEAYRLRRWPELASERAG